MSAAAAEIKDVTIPIALTGRQWSNWPGSHAQQRRCLALAVSRCFRSPQRKAEETPYVHIQDWNEYYAIDSDAK